MKNIMRVPDFSKLRFAVEANTTVTTDLEPAISIDHVERIAANINTLMAVLGITQMTPMASGTVVKRYKSTVTLGEKQAAEGDVIPLSKVDRKELAPLTLELDPKRKLTTAQAIQKVGRTIALDRTDSLLSQEVAKGIKKKFFDLISADTATRAAGGTNLQKAAAQAWASLVKYFDDKDVTPVFFVNPLDVANWLGDATITTQNAFGFQYLENFLGLGTAFMNPSAHEGKVFATATENLNGVYVPNGGDVAGLFDLTYDESGMIGMTHSRVDDRASIQTLLMSGVMFYPEDASGIIESDIAAAGNG